MEDTKYIEILEQFLDRYKEENIIDVYEKTVFRIMDYLEKAINF